MLTKEQNKEFMDSISSPSRSMSDAGFYAGMTGQNEIFSKISENEDRVANLVLSLIESGVIDAGLIEAAGCLGQDVQAFVDGSKSTDPRIVELKELTKLRFLVEKAGSPKTFN